MEIRIFYNQTVGGSAGTGIYGITIPDGRSIDPVQCRFGTYSVQAEIGTCVGWVQCVRSGESTHRMDTSIP